MPRRGWVFSAMTTAIRFTKFLPGDVPAEQVILPTEMDGLWLLPGSKNLTGANIELAGAEDRALRLRRAIEPVNEQLRA